MEKSKQQKKQSTAVRLVSLAPDDIRRLPRPHKGFEALVGPLIQLYKANEAALHIDGLDTDFIMESLASYQQLLEPQQKAAKELQAIQETRLFHASNAWRGVLEMYARAVVVGRVNADVARGIVEFAHFMKTGPRKKKASTPVAA